MAEITLDTVLNSKVYIQDKSQISFGSPRGYIEPFLEKFTKEGLNPTFRVAVSERVANKETESDTLNEAYGRVLVEAKLGTNFTSQEHDSVIGLVYALDTQKPTLRVYSGENAWACTNLAIFGAKYIHQVELLQGTSPIYDKALEYVDGLTEQLAKFNQIYERMNDTLYKGEQINEVLGYLLRESYKNKQIGTNPILFALKELEDNKSRYAIKNNETTQWNMYSAVTQHITDKVDILDKASKTVMVSNLFVKSI